MFCMRTDQNTGLFLNGCIVFLAKKASFHTILRDTGAGKSNRLIFYRQLSQYQSRSRSPRLPNKAKSASLNFAVERLRRRLLLH